MNNQQRQEFRQTLVQLRETLVNIDVQLTDEVETGQSLNPEVLKGWYLQHLLSLSIERALQHQTLLIPKFVGQWENCFGTSDPVLRTIWRCLIVTPNADQVILQTAFQTLQQALETQMVPVAIEASPLKWTLKFK